MTLFTVLDILGTIAFAISGALGAMDRKLDLFGIFIIAFVTAVGGGTLRDILIGSTPVNWMLDPYTIYYIIGSVVLAIVIRDKINYLKKSLFLFDTVGLGIFTITGVEIGIQTDLKPVISIALGVMTGCFGGVIRDILCNEIPVIFRKEIYAIASLAGGICFVVLEKLQAPAAITYVSTTLLIITIRLIVVIFKISLPSFTIKNTEDIDT